MGIFHREAVANRLKHLNVIQIIAKGSTFLRLYSQKLLHLFYRRALADVRIHYINPVAAAQNHLQRVRHSITKLRINIFLRMPALGITDSHLYDLFLLCRLAYIIHELTLGEILTHSIKIWFPHIGDKSKSFTADNRIRARYLTCGIQHSQYVSAVKLVGKQLLVMTCDKCAVFSHKKKIIDIFSHLLKKCRVLTSAGRSKEDTTRLKLRHDLIELRRHFSFRVKKCAVHITKNDFYHLNSFHCPLRP